jgi:hypothetical protein
MLRIDPFLHRGYRSYLDPASGGCRYRRGDEKRPRRGIDFGNS